MNKSKKPSQTLRLGYADWPIPYSRLFPNRRPIEKEIVSGHVGGGRGGGEHDRRGMPSLGLIHNCFLMTWSPAAQSLPTICLRGGELSDTPGNLKTCVMGLKQSETQLRWSEAQLHNVRCWLVHQLQRYRSQVRLLGHFAEQLRWPEALRVLVSGEYNV